MRTIVRSPTLAGAASGAFTTIRKPMVDAITGRGERKLNYRFVQMCSHYLVEPTMCNPAAAWEKGRVEKEGAGFTPASVYAAAEF